MTTSPAARPSANILGDDYAVEDDFATDNKVSKRTIERYRAQPDGLPFVEWGGLIHIHIPGAREWLRSRIKHRNQRRRAG
jgi:hypothetical protein